MRRLARLLCLAIVFLSATGAVAAPAGAASAGARARIAGLPPIPGWLDGPPRHDPAETQADAALRSFLRRDFDNAVAHSCLKALSAFRQASRLQSLVRNAYGAMVLAHEALKQNGLASVGLIGSRAVQAAAEIHLFFATLPAVESALAADAAVTATPAVSEFAKAMGNALTAEIKIIGQLANAYKDGQIDSIDGLLNSFSAANAAAALSGSKLKSVVAAGDPVVGLLGQILSGGKTIYDITDDFAKYERGATVAVKAYEQAGEHYSKLLAKLTAAVARMQAAAQACSQPPSPCPKTVTLNPAAGNGALSLETWNLSIADGLGGRFNDDPCTILTQFSNYGGNGPPIFLTATTKLLERGVERSATAQYLDDIHATGGWKPNPGAPTNASVILVTGYTHPGSEGWGIIATRIVVNNNCSFGNPAYDMDTGVYNFVCP
jgi:hypothetical protein